MNKLFEQCTGFDESERAKLSDCASGSNGLLCDAPIRDYVPEDSLCKNCTKILKDCKRIHKLSEIQNGFNVVTFCVGFDDYRNT